MDGKSLDSSYSPLREMTRKSYESLVFSLREMTRNPLNFLISLFEKWQEYPMNSYFLSAHFNKYHSFHIISEVFLRISKVILLLSKEISCETPWKEWGTQWISHHLSLKSSWETRNAWGRIGKEWERKGPGIGWKWWEMHGKKTEQNGRKWESRWRICEFALFEKFEDIWVCPVTGVVTRQSPTSSLGQKTASKPPKRKPGKT